MASGSLMRKLSLILLTVQNVTHLLVLKKTRTRTGPDHPAYFASSVVVVSECIKLIICVAILLLQDGWGYAYRVIRRDPWDSVKVSVPAFIYLVQNNLQFLAVSNLDAAVFQVTYQLKLLTTALFSVFLLRRRLSPGQWFALVILFLGVAIVNLGEADEKPTAKTPPGGIRQNIFVGLSAVGLSSVTSGFAGVYFEKVLKGSSTSLWLRNVQLALIGIVLGLGGQFFYERDGIASNGYLVGFDWLVWCLVALQSIGGLVVALVVKYADNILKGFACSAAIILSCVLSVVLFNITLSPQFLLGAALVIASILIYSWAAVKPAVVEVEKAKKDL